MIVPIRKFRSLAISLAILLAIIDVTRGFTLSYDQASGHDRLTWTGEKSVGLRRDLRGFDDVDQFDVAPILPLQPFALPLKSETITQEPTTPDGMENVTPQMNVTSEHVNNLNKTSSDFEPTVIPHKQDAVNITGNENSYGNAMINTNTTSTKTEVENATDTTPKYNDYQDVTVLLVKELRREYNTTPAIDQTETTTVITTPTVTDNYIELSNKEDINVNHHVDSTTSSQITSTVWPSIIEKITESHSTEVATETTVNPTVETTPAWKKYTTIERKLVDKKEEVLPIITERTGDSINAHTTETRVTLEKAFDLAPGILSLQELKTNLMDATNSIQTNTDSIINNDVTESIKSVEKTTTEQQRAQLPENNPTEMVSKRAGYLDHTKPSVEEVIPTSVNASGVSNEIEMEGVAYEVDMHDDNEDTQNRTSHSQLVEDAMKEEFLVEARLDDSIRFQTTSSSERPKTVEINEITASSQIKEVNKTNQALAEDLSVKSLSYDKKTTNNIYTVNPNYKPLKKIDVQPMKPFMRDPDDNSWRNESLSSLGIVFKGKNSSKAFTEVLKNKTEIEMSNLSEQDKNKEKVELRDRLEKITEMRKSKKKKTDKLGTIEYNDYEENNSGGMPTSKEKLSDFLEITTTTTERPISPQTIEWIPKGFDTISEKSHDSESTAPPKTTTANNRDYEDADYVTFPNIDILKATPRQRVQWPVTQKILDNTKPNVEPIRQFLPDRQPTVQYFPPRPKTIDENVRKYPDENPKQKFSLFGHTIQPNVNLEQGDEKYSDYRTEKYIPDEERNRHENKNPAIQAIQHIEYKPVEITDSRGFVIRHYKDLLESVIKDNEFDRNGNPYHRAPTTTVPDEGKIVKSEEYDYGQRKEELNRFVDNFNQNHERFKSDFPVVFNTSIVHGSDSGKVLASSSAMFKRLYDGGAYRETFSFSNKPYDPNCENVTVELSPAYELHYYVPDQEETGDHTMPYGYRP